MELHHIKILGLHPLQALLDTRPDIVAGIHVAVALVAWSRVGADHAPTFTRQVVLGPPVRHVAADALLTQAIVDRGVEIIDARIERGIKDGLGLCLCHVASTRSATEFHGSIAQHGDVQPGPSQLSLGNINHWHRCPP